MYIILEYIHYARQARKYYYPKTFETQKKQFEKFYNENKNQTFVLSIALKEYFGNLRLKIIQ